MHQPSRRSRAALCLGPDPPRWVVHLIFLGRAVSLDGVAPVVLADERRFRGRLRQGRPPSGPDFEPMPPIPQAPGIGSAPRLAVGSAGDLELSAASAPPYTARCRTSVRRKRWHAWARALGRTRLPVANFHPHCGVGHRTGGLPRRSGGAPESRCRGHECSRNRKPTTLARLAPFQVSSSVPGGTRGRSSAGGDLIVEHGEVSPGGGQERGVTEACLNVPDLRHRPI